MAQDFYSILPIWNFIPNAFFSFKCKCHYRYLGWSFGVERSLCHWCFIEPGDSMNRFHKLPWFSSGSSWCRNIMTSFLCKLFSFQKREFNFVLTFFFCLINYNVLFKEILLFSCPVPLHFKIHFI
jgi:hypothetical protein